MKRYFIKEAFLLQSFKPSPRLMQLGQYYATENEAEIEELERFAKDGSCEEVKSEKPKDLKPTKAPEKPAPPAGQPPAEDLTVVPGVGKKLQESLAGLGIVTVSDLKNRLSEEAVQEVLGSKAEKVAAYFAE
jgi:predicted flap endonuclease-1-like 5' DNA nuclease